MKNQKISLLQYDKQHTFFKKNQNRQTTELKTNQPLPQNVRKKTYIMKIRSLLSLLWE